MYQYGLPYDGAAGTFCPRCEEDVELMLDAVQRHPELHVVTYFKSGHVANRFVQEDALFYLLHSGNSDPEIEFTDEWSLSDDSPEQIKMGQEILSEFRDPNGIPTASEIAAVQWIMSRTTQQK